MRDAKPFWTKRCVSGRLVRPAVAALLLLLLIVPALAPGVQAGNVPVARGTETVETRTIFLPAPAVAEREDGGLIGIAATMEITLREGSGSVYLDTRPFAQLDMQGSARLAAQIASSVTGQPMHQHDFFVTMRAGSPIVGGPSAGGLMTVAFVALLMDWPIRDDVVMTGMINPDGTIGPVGGILEKAGAANDVGASRFLVPDGQAVGRRVVLDPATGEARTETVDIQKEAKDRWGIQVREVADVYDVVENFTGYRIEQPRGQLAEPSGLYGRVIGASAQHQHDLTVTERTAVGERLAAARAAGLDPSIAAAIDGYLETADDRLATAAEALVQENHYTASSRVFQARIELKRADIVMAAVDSGDERGYLARRIALLDAGIDETTQRAAAVVPRTVSSFEAIGAAQTRVFESIRLRAEAVDALATGQAGAAVQALGFAEERNRSVVMWLELAEALAADPADTPLAASSRTDSTQGTAAPPVSRDEALRRLLETMATEHLRAGQQAFTYATVLLEQIGADATASALLREARDDVADAQRALSLGLWAGALYLSVEAQVGSHAALSLVGSEARIDDRVARQEQQAILEIQRARAAGPEPVLAVSYFDFATSLREQNPTNSLLLFGFAATVARTSTQLVGGSSCSLALGVCEGAPAFRFTPHLEITDPWTGYLALASVVLGFLAGMLVVLVVQRSHFDGRVRALMPHPDAPTELGAAATVPHGGNGGRRARGARFSGAGGRHRYALMVGATHGAGTRRRRPRVAMPAGAGVPASARETTRGRPLAPGSGQRRPSGLPPEGA